MRIRSDFGKQQKLVYYWLLSGCALILLMVVIGGITRLTQSGLSMVTWEPVTGIIPPLSEQEWQEQFSLYQKSPEFKVYNADFTLDDYKQIYFWEYIHRLLGRLIGFVFIFPCFYFWIRGYFKSGMGRKVLLIFIGGAFQGGLGWFMVKSGLADNPHVSHYRLAAHLITAAVLMMFIYRVALGIKYERESSNVVSLKWWGRIWLGLTFLQVIYGAFVAGLKAGKMYCTFPLMGSEWWPDEFEYSLQYSGLAGFWNHAGLVQFVHRITGYALLLVSILMIVKVRKAYPMVQQRYPAYFVAGLIVVQATIGIVTLINAVPVWLGVLHQFVAMILLLAFTKFVYSTRFNR